MLIHAFIQLHINCVILIWGNATVTNLRPIKKKPSESNLYWTTLQKAQDIKLWATKKNSNRRIYVESEKLHDSKDSAVALLQMKYSIWTEYMARTTPNIIFHLQILNS